MKKFTLLFLLTNLFYASYIQTSLLHEAVKNNDIEQTKKLIKSSDINNKDKYGRTPLHLGMINESIETSILLLENGANSNITDSDNETALILACTCFHNQKNLHLVSQLLITKYNANINHKNNEGRSALHLTSRNDKFIKTTQFLIQAGANINHEDSWGWNPLCLAASDNSLKTIELLTEKGIQIKPAALHAAIFSNEIKATRKLIQLNINVNAPLGTNQKLLKALTSDFIEEFELEKKSKNFLQKLNTIIKDKPISILFKLKLNDYEKTVKNIKITKNKNQKVTRKKILKKLTEVFTDILENLTPLHIAAMQNSLEITELLIENNADINHKTIHNLRPLHIAIATDSKDITLALLEAGANIYNNKNDFGDKTLDYCQTKEIHNLITSKIERDLMTLEEVKTRRQATMKKALAFFAPKYSLSRQIALQNVYQNAIQASFRTLNTDRIVCKT